LYGGDGGEIDTGEEEGSGSCVEEKLPAAFPGAPLLRGEILGSGGGVEGCEMGLELAVTVEEAGGIEVVKLDGDFEREEVLWPIVTDEALANDFDGASAAMVAMFGENFGPTLSGEDGADDGHSGLSGDVGDDIAEDEVHLTQRLVHVLNVLGADLDEIGAEAQIRSKRADFVGRPKGGAEESEGMELLNPLAIENV
jgi:hypothetical protein